MKADANMCTLEKVTPLHIACDKNREDLVVLLLKYGAQVMLQNDKGLTAIDIAKKNGNPKLAAILENKSKTQI
jgi:ankyrin repeat protein